MQLTSYIPVTDVPKFGALIVAAPVILRSRESAWTL